MKLSWPSIERTIEGLMALDLTLMVVLIFSNVVGRYALNAGFAGGEELSRLLFVWLVFLGAILALQRQAHLGVELVQARLPRRLRRSCAVISHLLMLYALWLFLQGSWAQTLIGLGTYSTVLHMPNAFMASAGLVCAASMLVIVAVNLLRILANHPLAMVPGELRPGTPSPAAVPAEAAE